MSVYDWSLSALTNQTADGNINWAEGMPRNLVNDSARAMMSAIAAAHYDMAGKSVLGGTANAFALAMAQPMIANTNALISFVATRSNVAGAATMQIDGLAAFPLRFTTGVDLTAGQLIVGKRYMFAWNAPTSEYLLLGNGGIINTDYANMAATSVKANATGALAQPTDVPFATLTPLLSSFVASGASGAPGIVPTPGAVAGTTRFLREDASWTAPASFAASGASHAPGFVPDPGAVAGTSRFLREDATFATPFLLMPGTQNNLVIKTTSATAIALTADNISLNDGTRPYVSGALALTCSTSLSGVNGLDTGSMATGFYAVYLIYKPSTSTWGMLISLSETAPTLPALYTAFRRLGHVYWNGTSLVPTIQLNDIVRRINNGTILFPQMASGLAGSAAAGTYVAIPVAGFVPSTATEIAILAATGGGSANSVVIAAPNNNYGGYGSFPNPPLLCLTAANSVSVTLLMSMALESTNIYWANTAGAGASTMAIYCAGWREAL